MESRSLTLNQLPAGASIGPAFTAPGDDPLTTGGGGTVKPLSARGPPQRRCGPCTTACGACGTGRCVENSGSGNFASDGQLAYVGNGRGRFVQETKYRYVGLKGADYDIFHDSTVANRFLQWAAGCCCLTCLIATVLILANTHSSASGADQASTNLRVPGPPRNASFNCTARTRQEESGWSTTHADWCCNNFGRGCTGHGRSYHCDVGIDDWERAWSDEKKGWCCKHGKVGCAPERGAKLARVKEEEHDCTEGFDHWVEAWDIDKKVWCCINKDRGCPTRPPVPATTPATTSLPFDCSVGYQNWRNGWSDPMKRWCCIHARRGCPEAVPLPPPPPPPPR